MKKKMKWQPDPTQIRCPECKKVIRDYDLMWAEGGFTPQDKTYSLYCPHCRTLIPQQVIVHNLVFSAWGRFKLDVKDESWAAIILNKLLHFDCTSLIFREFERLEQCQE